MTERSKKIRAADAPEWDGAPEPAVARPGRPRRQNERRILEAAEAVFAEAGFGGASMQAIADRAGLPKANLHYYFGTKEQLYRRLLSDILDSWVDTFEHIRPDRAPAEALAAYLADKMRWSWERPLASRVFANEILHGAPQIEGYLRTKLRRRVEEKAKVMRAWAAEGRMAPVDPDHLFFMMWAATQTYADFDVQIRAVRGGAMDTAARARAADQVIGLILRGCGLAVPAITQGTLTGAAAE